MLENEQMNDKDNQILDEDGEPVVVRWMNYRFWPATLEQMMSDRLRVDLDGTRDSNCRLNDAEGNIIVPEDEEPDLPAPEEKR